MQHLKSVGGVDLGQTLALGWGDLQIWQHRTNRSPQDRGASAEHQREERQPDRGADHLPRGVRQFTVRGDVEQAVQRCSGDRSMERRLKLAARQSTGANVRQLDHRSGSARRVGQQLLKVSAAHRCEQIFKAADQVLTHENLRHRHAACPLNHWFPIHRDIDFIHFDTHLGEKALGAQAGGAGERRVHLYDGHVLMVAMHVTDRLAEVRQIIDVASQRAGRDSQSVRIVAATKYLGPEDLPALAASGLVELGENRLDSLVVKQVEAARLTLPVSWHFIGRLQSRKVPSIASGCAWIHTLASPSAAAQMAKLISAGSPCPRLLVQVNVGGDPAKDGITPQDVDAFLEQCSPELPIRGLMTMPPLSVDGGDSNRAAFAHLRELAERLASSWNGAFSFDELSMGTTQDFAIAVEEGATMVRLGRALYADARIQ